MPHDRFFSHSPLNEGDLITLSQDEGLHLTTVMRHQEGDLVELCNGAGTVAKCEVEAVGKKGVKLRILRAITEKDQAIEVALYLAHLPHKLLDFVIEKGTELGITHFYLYSSERSRESLSPSHQERLHKIAISSIKQSGRLYLPHIEEVGALAAWTSFPKLTLFGTLQEAPTLFETYKKEEPVSFIIGPQSGLTPQEEAHLIHIGAKPVRLYKQTLRAETAALAAAALLTSRCFLKTPPN